MDNLVESPRLIDLQKHLDAFVKSKGWDTKTISEVFLLFTEEIGELAKAIRKKTGLKKEENDQANLEEEFADVLNYLMELANRCDVDLEQAYRNKNALNKTRVWAE